MLRAGEVFAGYEIERELGRGGMGSVYLARHPRLPRLIALKLLNRDLFGDIEVRRRFEREADVVARLEHPNIVPVYDRGIDEDQLWIAMRYIDGVDASVLEPSNLPPQHAIRIIGETARALDFAHRRGVLHRDVKPANILLERMDGEERVFLADFGIARLRDDQTKLTQTGSFTATLTYASPEQLSGQPLDPKTDQYSLACTLFRLLTGTVPFAAEHPVGIIHGHLSTPPPAVSALRPGLPPALDPVLARALAKHPDDRFANCLDFANAAQQALTNPAAATAVMSPRPVSDPRLQQVPPGASRSVPTQFAQPTAPFPPAGTPTRRRPVPPPRRKRSKLRGCLMTTAAILAIMVVGLGALTIYLERGQRSNSAAPSAPATPVPTTDETDTTTAPPTTTPAVPDHLGGYAERLSQRFPAMLPLADPEKDVNTGTGYQGANCTTYGKSTPPPTTGADDPDLGDWTLLWQCAGGGNRAAYRFVLYESPADVQAAIAALPANTKSSVTANGHNYTNYVLQGSQLFRPRMVTEFDDGTNVRYLMYSAGFIATDDDLVNWWKGAPVN
ncbi:serine/threonine-protein kinase [Nocardia sp. NPDC088792]|uniref:serine/threonine-protein kinase n=1 Tax=Nocardia sp. NPDC088792 TaxID=3364332 RepID=UPI00382DC8EB